MRNTLAMRAAAARQPMIKFLGKRKTPQSVDHSPKPHPAASSQSLPDSFANYRVRAQQHGPIGGRQKSNSNSNGSSETVTPKPFQASTNVKSMDAYGVIGGKAGRSLGSVRPKEGEFFDRSELPRRFQRMSWTEAEMDAVSSGGASMF